MIAVETFQKNRQTFFARVSGPQEVEIFSSENWWKRTGDEVLATCAEHFLTKCIPQEQPVTGE